MLRGYMVITNKVLNIFQVDNIYLFGGQYSHLTSSLDPIVGEDIVPVRIPVPVNNGSFLEVEV
jgi:hypothetical protein